VANRDVVAGEDEAEVTVESESQTAESSETAESESPAPESKGSETEASGSEVSESDTTGSQESESDTSEAEEDSEEMAELESELSEEGFDHAAESFIEVEEELQGTAEGMRGRGQAIDVEKVPASEVPEDFPAKIETEHALALRLSMIEANDQTVVTYFEWPEQGTDERLARLMELKDVPPDRFADLHGEKILLTIEEGYYMPVIPSEEPRGDDRAVYGIYAGLAPSVLILLAGLIGATGAIATGSFFLLWVIATVIVLPISVYMDAWDLRTSTDWDGGPLFWTFMSAIPGFNMLAVPLYLLSRSNAEPLMSN
jgi:hypothetical protein